MPGLRWGHPLRGEKAKTPEVNQPDSRDRRSAGPVICTLAQQMIPPKKNDRFRTTKALEVQGIIIFGAPCSGGFRGQLPAGEVMILDYEPKPWAKGVWLRPERYRHFEQLFVDEKTRRDPEYDRFAVNASYDELSENYEAIAGS
jgi:hypothetical protein